MFRTDQTHCHEKRRHNRGPRDVRFFNVSHTRPETVDPYGGLSGRVANNLYNQQLKPYTTLLGAGTGKQYAKMQGQLDSGAMQGPLADLIRGIQGFSPDVVNQAAGIGAQAANQAPGVYDSVKAQIQGALGQLPGMQQGAAQASQYAAGGLADAYAPVGQSALFGATANRVLQPQRAGEAARGLAGGGAGQAAETRTLSDIGMQFAANAPQQQALAQQAYGSALGNQQQLSQAGIPIAQQGYQNSAQLAQQLAQRYNIPMQAAGSLLQLLTAEQANQLGVTQATAPTVSQSSGAFGFL